MSAVMTAQWTYLLVAVALLWFPRQWYRSGRSILKKRRKPDGALERLAGLGARDPDDRAIQPAREFANFRNYADLFRGLAGGYGLTHFALPASTGDAATGTWVVGGIMLISVLIQIVRYNGRLSFFAPIFFLFGLNVGGLGPLVPAFAFGIVLAINPIIPNPRLFLSAYGLLLLPFGYVFDCGPLELGLQSVLVLLTPLLSLLTKRPVVLFSRKAKPAARS